MTARHALPDEPAPRRSPPALHLVEGGMSPEVRLVLETVEALHQAVVRWAAATVRDPAPAPEDDDPPMPAFGAGRHSRRDP